MESCVLAPKTSSDKPKTVSTSRETTTLIPTTEDDRIVVTKATTSRPGSGTKKVKRTSTMASTTENAEKEAVEGKDGAISAGGNILGVKCDSGGNGCDEEDLSSYIVW